MSFFLYILRCSDGLFYVGQTNNLEKRLAEHNAQKFGGYTSSRLPVELVFSSSFATRREVLVAEKRIKKWSAIKKQALVDGQIKL